MRNNLEPALVLAAALLTASISVAQTFPTKPIRFIIPTAAGGGSDRVFAAASFVLEATSEIEIISTTSAAGAGAINLTGSSTANHLVGNAGANTLNGGGGADIMQGLGGNDWYYVDNAGDRAVEAASGGSDRIFAAVSFTLEARRRSRSSRPRTTPVWAPSISRAAIRRTT